MSDTPELSAMRALGELILKVAEQLRVLMEEFCRRMREFWASPDGQYLIQVVEYYEDHPDELNAMIRARELKATRQHCHCLCGRWDHLGLCVTDASTHRVMGGVSVPLCDPCAVSIDAHRVG